MNPSFTPCFFSNSSLCILRISMRGPMSTSWKVVNMAAVFWASFSLCAMRCLMRVIFTRVSPRLFLAGAAEEPAGAGVATGLAGVFAAAFSAGAAVFSAVAGAAEVLLLVSVLPAPSSSTKRGAPTSTSSPSAARSSTTVPEKGLWTSTVTLSVSILARMSSAFTTLPTSTVHSARTPWVIDSPIDGTGISCRAPEAADEASDAGAGLSLTEDSDDDPVDDLAAGVAAASVSILYKGAPISSSPPASVYPSTNTPAPFALMSIVTLSVSTTAMTSSSAMESPAFFCHSTITAEVIESPRLSKGTSTTEKCRGNCLNAGSGENPVTRA
mmetsp:Transcript_84776/g.182832  ORF Transcript_84776/g.182832 Transcript_84776/m.182832 type:complete len:327 (-) Transcript_84776:144-1124(-)